MGGVDERNGGGGLGGGWEKEKTMGGGCEVGYDWEREEMVAVNVGGEGGNETLADGGGEGVEGVVGGMRIPMGLIDVEGFWQGGRWMKGGRTLVASEHAVAEMMVVARQWWKWVDGCHGVGGVATISGRQ